MRTEDAWLPGVMPTVDAAPAAEETAVEGILKWPPLLLLVGSGPGVGPGRAESLDLVADGAEI